MLIDLVPSTMTTTQPAQKRVLSAYPDPLVVPPIADHQQTLIILHGRGSNANDFGPLLLDTRISDSHTVRSSFPNAKFIFPTASKRRAQIYKRSVIHQWFDNWSLQEPNERTGLQVEGLRETSSYIHSLIRQAIDEIGARNVILGGLSQGCAATLISLLTWDGEPIAAGFGMCGWLPFRKQMEDIARPSELEQVNDGEGDLFEASEEDTIADLPNQAASYLLEELELSQKQPSMSFQQVPLFLGHGVKDEKVPIGLGREAASCLRAMDMELRWSEYEGLGHWYSSEMLSDLAEFLKKATKLNEAPREQEDSPA